MFITNYIVNHIYVVNMQIYKNLMFFLSFNKNRFFKFATKVVEKRRCKIQLPPLSWSYSLKPTIRITMCKCDNCSYYDKDDNSIEFLHSKEEKVK